MPRTTKIALEKIVTVQKRFRAMPVKDNRKAPEEALKMLSEDVRNMLEKGYSMKDVRVVLIEEGVPLSSFVLRKHLEQEAQKTEQAEQETVQATPPKEALETRKTLPADSEKVPPGKEKNVPLKEVKTPPSYGGINIKPDTPDEEL